MAEEQAVQESLHCFRYDGLQSKKDAPEGEGVAHAHQVVQALCDEATLKTAWAVSLARVFLPYSQAKMSAGE